MQVHINGYDIPKEDEKTFLNGHNPMRTPLNTKQGEDATHQGAVKTVGSQ